MDLLKIDNTEKVGDLFNKALPKGQLEEFLTELMVFYLDQVYTWG